MKATFKSIAIALSILAVVLVVLTAVDAYNDTTVSTTETHIKITVVDLNGIPVHNAQITVCGQTFYTDNKGLSPAIQIVNLNNCYDESITEWGTVTVVVQKDGYTPAFVLNSVVYTGQTRKLIAKIYPLDSSELPYVSYVESPPDNYLKSLLNSEK